MGECFISRRGGSSGDIQQLNVTANGTYTAPERIGGYSPVVVDVSSGTTTFAEKTDWALALWLDGIENVGKGIPHSSSASYWYDLANNSQYPITNGVWSSNNLRFNGVSTYVNCGQKDLKICSLEVLVSFDNVVSSGYGSYVAGNWDAGGYGITQYTGKNEFEVYLNNRWVTVLGSASEALTPIVLTGVCSGSDIKLFENGNLVTTISQSGIIGSPQLSTIFAIGGNPSGSTITTGWLAGNIYSVRLYSVALSDSVVLGLSNELRNKYGLV